MSVQNFGESMESIRKEHQECLYEAIVHANTAGKLLLSAKANLEAYQFAAFCSSLGIGGTQAGFYIWVASNIGRVHPGTSLDELEGFVEKGTTGG